MPALHRGLARTLVVLLALALATSCGSGKGSTSATTPPASPAPQPTSSLHAHPATPVPPAALGEWVSLTAKDYHLKLEQHTYTVIIGGQRAGSGSVGAVGNRLAFFQGSLCRLGTGWYSWTVTRGRLTLRPSGADPCEGRTEVADTYTRLAAR
jgi:hypothetical protein